MRSLHSRQNPVSDHWEGKSQMIQPSEHCQAVTVDRCVYVIDGKNRSVQEYDINRDMWQVRARMPGQCYNSTAVRLGQDIYVAGGRTTVQCLAYSSQTDTWTVLGNPAVARGFPAAVVWDGRVLLSGGWAGGTTTNAIEEYHPQNKEWSNSKASLPLNLAGHNLLLVKYVWNKT